VDASLPRREGNTASRSRPDTITLSEAAATPLSQRFSASRYQRSPNHLNANNDDGGGDIKKAEVKDSHDFSISAPSFLSFRWTISSSLSRLVAMTIGRQALLGTQEES